MRNQRSVVPFVAGFGAGALCAALLDPRRGAARRAKIRDQAFSFAKCTVEDAERMARDFLQRATGRIYELRHRGESVPDDLLVERVRAQIGKPLSHPHAVVVRAENGIVTLTGEALRWEVVPLLDIVAKVRGVHSIRNELRTHDDATSFPTQPGGERSGAAGKPRPTS